MIKEISSTNNPLIKKINALTDKSRERKKQGLFIVEGAREVSLAIKGGHEISTLLFCPEIADLNALPNVADSIEKINVSLDVYQKIAYRATTEGVIAIVKNSKTTLDALIFPKGDYVFAHIYLRSSYMLHNQIDGDSGVLLWFEYGYL